MAARKKPTSTEDNPLADFRVFLVLVWRHLGLPDPTPIQLDFASYLQNGPKRMIGEAFRGIGKSWVTCAFVVHQLYLNPNLKVLIVSASKSLADNNATFIKRLIQELPELQHLKAKTGQRDSMIEFDVGPARAAKDPSVKSVGITGQITGTRADLIIADDIEVPNNSSTTTMREKIHERVKEFDAIIKPDDGSRIIYLGTPHFEFSLYSVLEQRGYITRIWPVLFPSPTEIDKKYGSRLAPFVATILENKPHLVGTTTEPKRFSMDDIEERKVSFGKAGFALQYMLDTSLSDIERYPLKLSDLIVTRLDPNTASMKYTWGNGRDLVLEHLPAIGMPGDHYHSPFFVEKQTAEYTTTVMAIDPSGRGKDETAFAVCKFLAGYIFVMDAGGLPGGYDDDTLGALATKMVRWNVHDVVIEDNFGDGMFTKLLQTVMLKNGAKASITEIKNTTQKETRIVAALEPVMMQHRLVVDERVIEADYQSVQGLPPEKARPYMLFHQMTRVTKERGALDHDDRLEALSMAVKHFTDLMVKDADKSLAAEKAKLLDAELRRFTNAVLKRTGKRSGWVR